MPEDDQGPVTGGSRPQVHSLKIRIVYNPRTGRKREKRFKAVLALLEAGGHTSEILITTKAGDAAGFVRETTSDNADILAIAGGDGTINDAIQGAGPQTPPLGLIPLGTANVLAHELGIGTDPHRIANCLVEARSLKIRPGQVNGHRFMMMAGIGLDAQVVSDLSRATKTRFGKAAYLIEVFRTLSRWTCPPVDVRLDGEPEKAATLIVSRGKRYGGTFVLAPHCDLANPSFCATIFPPGSALSVFGRFLLIPAGLLLRLGLVAQQPARTVEILGPRGDPIQADGDIVAHAPAQISVCEQPIRLCVPVSRR
ncbi:diacylglycerol kinase family protein [uncultured Roseibium sp.]|uniref:diacylglycerol/lipid kinase family protein n=1 Tax=uncultured Roseibium sp. TaxID=1936171 RepID=UPI0026330C1D|nr:diacylglycerol kinase family protein [uncultured Roseibium sp.]